MSTQIHGVDQIIPDTIKDVSISSTAAILTSKLADSAKFFFKDGTITATGNFNLGGFKVINAADPTISTDLATKNYVDSIAQGLSAKGSCILATTSPLPTNSYNNGSSGVGATLTATGFGALTIDGSAVATND